MQVRIGGSAFIHKGRPVDVGEVIEMDDDEARAKIKKGLVSEVRPGDENRDPKERDHSRTTTASASSVRDRDPKTAQPGAGGEPSKANAPNAATDKGGKS